MRDFPFSWSVDRSQKLQTSKVILSVSKRCRCRTFRSTPRFILGRMREAGGHCRRCQIWKFLRGAGGRPWNETGRRIGICRQYSGSVAEMSIHSPQVHPLNCLSTQGNGTATGETYRKIAISCGAGGRPFFQKFSSRSCPWWQPRPLWIGLDWPPVISSLILPSWAALGPGAGWVPRVEHHSRRTIQAPPLKQNSACREVLLPMAQADGLKYQEQ